MIDTIQALLVRTRSFATEAHALLGRHEGSPSRIVELDETYKELKRLTLRQDDLMRQALRCLENALFRAAHVMSWAAFMDFFEEKLASDGLVKLRAARPNWTFTSIEDLREKTPEFQLIEAAHAAGLCQKNEAKALQGLLNKRNECAHPSDFYPGLNESLGYVSELLKRISHLRDKSY
jgi:hypothetical protein